MDELLRRMVAAEELLTHLDQAAQHLSEAVIEQQRRLKDVERGLARLRSQVEALAAGLGEHRDLEEPPPPHY